MMEVVSTSETLGNLKRHKAKYPRRLSNTSGRMMMMMMTTKMMMMMMMMMMTTKTRSTEQSPL
jgi:hypothetical protein